MHILVSNDDGIDSPGLAALAEVAAGLGEVWVVAPQLEQSAKSHSFTMHHPVRVERRRERWFAVDGTPADCVYIALHNLLPEAPGLVLSGVNRGSNLGDDVHYSGTVAAAMEAAFHGVPAIAVSLDLRWKAEEHHWLTAGHFALELSRLVLERGMPAQRVLNLNVPDRPVAEVRGMMVTRQGRRIYQAAAEERVDPRGRRYYWLGGTHDRFVDVPGSDGPLTRQGWATVTPLKSDLTDEVLLAAIEGWSLPVRS